MTGTIDKVAMLRQLREETGYGLHEVKKALENNDWDIWKARAYLRQCGGIGVMGDSHWQEDNFTWL